MHQVTIKATAKVATMTTYHGNYFVSFFNRLRANIVESGRSPTKTMVGFVIAWVRSEERRVGKECRL